MSLWVSSSLYELKHIGLVHLSGVLNLVYSRLSQFLSSPISPKLPKLDVSCLTPRTRPRRRDGMDDSFTHPAHHSMDDTMLAFRGGKSAQHQQYQQGASFHCAPHSHMRVFSLDSSRAAQDNTNLPDVVVHSPSLDTNTKFSTPGDVDKDCLNIYENIFNSLDKNTHSNWLPSAAVYQAKLTTMVHH